jgi:hypothetical protein
MDGAGVALPGGIDSLYAQPADEHATTLKYLC